MTCIVLIAVATLVCEYSNVLHADAVQEVKILAHLTPRWLPHPAAHTLDLTELKTQVHK